MKRSTLVLVLSLLVLALALPGCGGSGRPAGPATLVDKGAKLPDLVGKGVDGRDVRLADLVQGKVAVVDVWATWCAPCVMAMPELEKLHSAYADKGFTVVGIMIDGNASRIGPGFVRDWNDGKGLAYPVILDDNASSFTSNFGPLTGVPLLYLVDRDGTILERHTGTGDLGSLLRKVQELMEAPAEQADPAAEAAGSPGEAPAPATPAE